MAAKQFTHSDDWKNEILTCPKCGWSGRFDEGSVELHAELMDSSCPRCEWPNAPMLAIVSYPVTSEAQVSFDRMGERKAERKSPASYEAPPELDEEDERILDKIWDNIGQNVENDRDQQTHEGQV